MSLQRILIYTGKYDTDYYDASTDVQLEAAYYAIFKKLDSDCFFNDIEFSEEEKELKELLEVKKNLGNIPEALQNAAEQKLKRLNFIKEQMRVTKYQKDKLDLARKGDRKAAKALMIFRSSYEYEQTTLRNVIAVE